MDLGGTIARDAGVVGVGGSLFLGTQGARPRIVTALGWTNDGYRRGILAIHGRLAATRYCGALLGVMIFIILLLLAGIIHSSESSSYVLHHDDSSCSSSNSSMVDCSVSKSCGRDNR